MRPENPMKHVFNGVLRRFSQRCSTQIGETPNMGCDSAESTVAKPYVGVVKNIIYKIRGERIDEFRAG